MKKFLTPLFLVATMYASENTIVIYNNLALLDEYKNNVEIKKGINEYVYENISPNLIYDSVSLNSSHMNIIEQNYKFDTVNFRTILNKYINKEVLFYSYFDKNSFNKLKGTILSIEGNNCLIKYGSGNDTAIKLIPFEDIIVNKLPEGMITKPSLVFKYKADNDYTGDINLKYLSNGFSWTANYVAELKKDKLHLNGFISLTNNNDFSLNDYNLKIVAGSINTLNSFTPRTMSKNINLMVAADTMESNIENVSLEGYHVYNIPYKVNIDKKETKQLSFLNLDISKWNKINSLTLNDFSQDNVKFNQEIRFENTKENGAGIPLPNGKIRVYKDSDKQTFFLGENIVGNISENENLKINIGQDFDSNINFKVIDLISMKTNYSFKFEYNLNNSSNEEKEYEITQLLPYTELEKDYISIFSKMCTLENSCFYNFTSKNQLKINFKIKPKSKVDFDFKVVNKY